MNFIADSNTTTTITKVLPKGAASGYSESSFALERIKLSGGVMNTTWLDPSEVTFGFTDSTLTTDGSVSITRTGDVASDEDAAIVYNLYVQTSGVNVKIGSAIFKHVVSNPTAVI